MCLTGTYKIAAIADVIGSTLRHVLKIPFWEFRKGLKYYESAMPVKIEALHVLNSNSFVKKIYGQLKRCQTSFNFGKFLSLSFFFAEMAKFFMSKELAERIHFYSGDVNWDEFYANQIPKSHLPGDAEYGGDLEKVAILHEKSLEKLAKFEDYFKAEENLIYDNVKDVVKDKFCVDVD